MNDTNIFENLKKFIQDASDIEDLEKTEYLACLEALMRDDLNFDLNTLEDLNDYLEDTLTLLEDEAITKGDTDSINWYADLRNARHELEKKLFMIKENVPSPIPAAQTTPPSEQNNIPAPVTNTNISG